MATPNDETGSTFELTAADLTDGFAVEGLGDETALGTWGSASSWSSASCPASTASTGGSASSFG
ncbi:thiocillin family RiPP [Dermatophilaceae bacterium Soc4.6]